MMMMLVACLGRNVRMERMMIEEAAACYVSVLRRLQHDSGVCSTLARVHRSERGKSIPVGNIDGYFHVMMTLMMITISEPVTSWRWKIPRRPFLQPSSSRTFRASGWASSAPEVPFS